MMLWKNAIRLQLLFVLFLLQFTEGKRCNEVICASVVSKCILTQACKCDFKSEKCSCCVTCMKCLGDYYERCCNCLDMCDPDASKLDFNSNDSQVGDFTDSFIEYFSAITETEIPLVNGITISYPADLALEELTKRLEKSSYKKHLKDRTTLLPMPTLGVNCTVVFTHKCHSASSCKEICHKYGSMSYRYFFNGCCECVGPSCLNYGINEPRCSKCSSITDDADYFEFDSYSNDLEPSNAIKKD